MRKGCIAQAKFRLNRLHDPKWGALQPLEKFRVLANLGHCARAEENFEDAARLLLEAKAFLPQSDEKARYAEVIAYVCQNNLSKARELSISLHRDFPESASAHA